MSTVRRVVVEGPDSVQLVQAPAPQPAAGEVVVRPTFVGICGSDMHAAHGRHPFIPLPFEPGHEAVGVIEAVGEGVEPARVGSRVVVDPGGHCGRCEQCRAGRTNICDHLDVFGCLSSGAMADRFVIDAGRVIDLPEDLPDRLAVLTEPMSTPVHAVRRAGDLTGKRVVVVGAGPIGLFLVVAARRAGAESIVVHDLLDTKRERALRLGATAAVDPSSPNAIEETIEKLDGQRANVVFDAVANETTTRTAIRSLLVRGGRLMVVGVPAGPVSVDLELVQDNEIEIIGNLMFTREDILTALDILGSHPFEIGEVITAEYAVEQVQGAFHASDDPENVKVLVAFGG